MKYQLTLPDKTVATYGSRENLMEAIVKHIRNGRCSSFNEIGVHDEYGNPISVSTLRKWLADYRAKQPSKKPYSRLSESKLTPAMLTQRLRAAPGDELVHEVHELVGSRLTTKALKVEGSPHFCFKDKSIRSENGRSWKCAKGRRQWQRHHKYKGFVVSAAKEVSDREEEYADE